MYNMIIKTVRITITLLYLDMKTYPCTRAGRNPNTHVNPNSVAKQMKFLTTLHTFFILFEGLVILIK